MEYILVNCSEAEYQLAVKREFVNLLNEITLEGLDLKTTVVQFYKVSENSSRIIM